MSPARIAANSGSTPSRSSASCFVTMSSSVACGSIGFGVATKSFQLSFDLSSRNCPRSSAFFASSALSASVSERTRSSATRERSRFDDASLSARIDTMSLSASKASELPAERKPFSDNALTTAAKPTNSRPTSVSVVRIDQFLSMSFFPTSVYKNQCVKGSDGLRRRRSRSTPSPCSSSTFRCPSGSASGHRRYLGPSDIRS